MGYSNFEKRVVSRTDTTKLREVIPKDLYPVSLTILPLFIDTNLFLLSSDISEIQMSSDKTHKGYVQKKNGNRERLSIHYLLEMSTLLKIESFTGY